MTRKDRETVFWKTNGKCAYCGCELQKGWHVDHVEALGRNSKYCKDKKRFVHDGTCNKPQNDHIDNYMPSCPSCNITKSGMSVQSFREYIERTVTILNANHYAAYRFAKRYGLVAETPKPVVFYFEQSTNKHD